jgi:hypothetical protein
MMTSFLCLPTYNLDVDNLTVSILDVDNLAVGILDVNRLTVGIFDVANLTKSPFTASSSTRTRTSWSTMPTRGTREICTKFWNKNTDWTSFKPHLDLECPRPVFNNTSLNLGKKFAPRSETGPQG